VDQSKPDQRASSSISPSKYARWYLLIGILSTISIWIILHSPWSTFVRPDSQSGGSTSFIVPDASNSTLLGTLFSTMVIAGRAALLGFLSWSARASPTDLQDSFEFDCIGLPYRLNGTNVPNTTISLSQYLPGGTTLDLSGVINSTCLNPRDGPTSLKVPFDVCRVAAYTKTSERSAIHYEVWLPRSWSGRFISHGNGGLSGCIFTRHT
jgi:hypothetical protein